uniref:Wings apart-like protein C-terminal domain-containing protein n=1 Tax=Mycena chlorophos TaxID=658473 RepID=A0ABQ0LBR2_MYCCL|nr:predicted protein [Mycena chlorophos]
MPGNSRGNARSRKKPLTVKGAVEQRPPATGTPPQANPGAGPAASLAPLVAYRNSDSSDYSSSSESSGSDYSASQKTGSRALKRQRKDTGSTRATPGNSQAQTAGTGTPRLRAAAQGATGKNQRTSITVKRESLTPNIMHTADTGRSESPLTVLSDSGGSAAEGTVGRGELVGPLTPKLPPISLPPRPHTKATKRRGPRKKSKQTGMDLFDDASSSVSVAEVLDGLKGLNYSLDVHVREILRKALELCPMPDAARSQTLQADKKYDGCNILLLSALADYADDEDGFGYVLDTLLHHIVVSEIYEHILSGDVVSYYSDPTNHFQAVFQQMARKQNWRAVQRWRSFTAASNDDEVNGWKTWLPGTIASKTQSIVLLLAFAFRREPDAFQTLGPTIEGALVSMYEEAKAVSTTMRRDAIVLLLAFAFRREPDAFQTLGPAIEAALAGMYEEAKAVSTTMRRDVLSDRLSAHCPTGVNAIPFDHTQMTAVWEMGDKDGDEIVGLYHFGLREENSDGIQSYVAKPAVVTVALLRALAAASTEP